MTEIFAFCGTKGSGKSHAALLLEKKGFKRVSFAAPLKEICAKVFTKHEEFFYKPELKEAYFKVTEYDITKIHKQLLKEIFLKLGLTEEGADIRIKEESVSGSPFLSTTSKQMLSDLEEFVADLFRQQIKSTLTARYILQRLGTDVMRKWDEDIHVNMFEEAAAGLQRFVCDDVRFPNEVAHLKDRGAEIVWLHRPALGERADTHASETSIGPSDCHFTIKSEEGVLLDQAVNKRLLDGEWQNSLKYV